MVLLGGWRASSPVFTNESGRGGLYQSTLGKISLYNEGKTPVDKLIQFQWQMLALCLVREVVFETLALHKLWNYLIISIE